MRAQHANGFNLPIFLQDWWLAAACHDERATFDIRAEEAGRLVGWWRYIVYRNKIGCRLGASPFWSHLGGPVLRDGLSPHVQRGAVRALVRQLPPGVSFEIVCDPNAEGASVIAEELAAAGFHKSLLPTYLHRPDDPDILQSMKGRHRAQIKTAAKAMVIKDMDPGAFIDFYQANLPSRSHSPLAVAGLILREGIAREQARILVAVTGSQSDAEGMPDAAIACVWDKHRYYYWLSARRRQPDVSKPAPNKEATKLLILAAVAHAKAMNLVFDADSPETIGGRALFERIFAFKRVEYRHVFTRRTILTTIYDRAAALIKDGIKSAYPEARIHAPRKR